MLRLRGGQAESLWDGLLPERLRELPDDLARLGWAAVGEALLSADRGAVGSRAGGSWPLGAGGTVGRRSRSRRTCGCWC